MLGQGDHRTGQQFQCSGVLEQNVATNVSVSRWPRFLV
jgi:hypothetical protein